MSFGAAFLVMLGLGALGYFVSQGLSEVAGGIRELAAARRRAGDD